MLLFLFFPDSEKKLGMSSEDWQTWWEEMKRWHQTLSTTSCHHQSVTGSKWIFKLKSLCQITGILVLPSFNPFDFSPVYLNSFISPLLPLRFSNHVGRCSVRVWGIFFSFRGELWWLRRSIQWQKGGFVALLQLFRDGHCQVSAPRGKKTRAQIIHETSHYLNSENIPKNDKNKKRRNLSVQFQAFHLQHHRTV